MASSIGTRLKNAWNAFSVNDEPTKEEQKVLVESTSGMGYSSRPDRPRLTRGHEKSIVNSIYSRIAIDCSAIRFCHAKFDSDHRYLKECVSGLNNCLTVEANKDQTSRAFIQDIVMSMFDEGCVAVIPVDTSVSVVKENAYDILSMRTAKIQQWFPDAVQVRLYNDRTGNFENITLPKKSVAIIENPFYSVMNEPNSTLQRLIRKLNILDAIDEQSGSGKMNMIIQLPYLIKTDARKRQAEARREEIEKQLVDSKYGIAYTDGTEHVTQLNRPLENNLMSQIEYLTNMLYSQLGITTSILDGTADEKTMLNYTNGTIEIIVSAIVNEFRRKFLTKTARTQGQDIMYFKDPFRLVPVSQIAEIADKFTRNEIMTSNEIRQIVGYKPIDNPEADELRNKNLSQPAGANPLQGMNPEDEQYDYQPEEQLDLIGDNSK